MINETDVLIVGAGVGGLCAAARLSHAGYKVLLVESLPRIGGRASTREIDGFLVNTGGFALERDGSIAQMCEELNIPLGLYIPEVEAVLLTAKREIPLNSRLVTVARSFVPVFLKTITKLLPFIRPREDETVGEWLNRFTKNKKLHTLVENVNCSMFAATNKELRAAVFLDYFSTSTAFKKLGLGRRGTISVWEPMVELIEANGGSLLLDSKVTKLYTENGRIVSADIECAGNTQNTMTKLAISNVGPAATVKLVGERNLPDGYAESVNQATAPATIVSIHFASRKKLVNFPGVAFCASTNHLAYLANFSAPELQRCPPGWFLYTAASIPRPLGRGELDAEHEVMLLKQDLQQVIPGFDRAKILDVDITAGDWPAQRAIMGDDLPVETPIKNLWNVGDGVKPHASAGTRPVLIQRVLSVSKSYAKCQ